MGKCLGVKTTVAPTKVIRHHGDGSLTKMCLTKWMDVTFAMEDVRLVGRPSMESSGLKTRRSMNAINKLIDLFIIERRDGLIAREATPIGAVVLARGAETHAWYVTHNGKQHYKGNDPDHAVRIYHLILDAAQGTDK